MNKLIIGFDSVLGTIWSCWTNQFSPLPRSILGIERKTDVQVELVRNLMAHEQKPYFFFRLNGRVHLNRRGSQFSRLLAAEVRASALVMLYTPRSEIVWEYWLPTPFASFPFTSPPVRHHVPPHSERSILQISAEHVWKFSVPSYVKM